MADDARLDTLYALIIRANTTEEWRAINESLYELAVWDLPPVGAGPQCEALASMLQEILVLRALAERAINPLMR